MLAEAGQTNVVQDDRAKMIQTVGMIVLMIVMFYFVLFRPQQKKAKEHAQLLKSIRPGDKIVTSGGIMGAVLAVKEKSVTIRSADTKMEVTKASVAEIFDRSGEAAES